jgi:rod shape-determining protein MreD
LTPPLLARLELAARRMVPFLVTVGLVIMTAIPTRLPGFAQVAPSWPMMGIFYWSIYRPDLMPVWGAFLIGILTDIVGGTPLGINALLFLLIREIVVGQRRFFITNAFPLAWATFAVIALGALGLNWLLFVILQNQAVSPQILIWQYLILSGLFPLVTVTLAYTQMVMLKDV